MERQREQHDVATHAVEPRKREEPLVDQVPVRGEAVDRDDRRPRLVAPMTKHARVRDAVGAVPQVRLVLTRIDGLERAVEAQRLAGSVLGLEARKPTALLRAHPNPRGRRREEARGSADSAMSA